MKRVLLLAWLITSLVELDLEGGRIYLLSSTASLLLILCGELLRRRKATNQLNARAFATGEGGYREVKKLGTEAPVLCRTVESCSAGSNILNARRAATFLLPLCRGNGTNGPCTTSYLLLFCR